MHSSHTGLFIDPNGEEVRYFWAGRTFLMTAQSAVYFSGLYDKLHTFTPNGLLRDDVMPTLLKLCHVFLSQSYG